MYKRNIEVHACNHFYGVKATVIQGKCVFVPFVIEHAQLMRGIILQSVACLAVQCVLTLSHKRQDFFSFGKRVTKYKMFFFCFLYNVFLKHLSF